VRHARVDVERGAHLQHRDAQRRVVVRKQDREEQTRGAAAADDDGEEAGGGCHGGWFGRRILAMIGMRLGFCRGLGERSIMGRWFCMLECYLWDGVRVTIFAKIETWWRCWRVGSMRGASLERTRRIPTG